MKRLLSLLIAFLIFYSPLFGQESVPQYDIEGAGSATEGYVLVKVFVYKKRVSDQDLKRAAVHGVVFRGCSVSKGGATQPAMAPVSAEHSNKAFCKSFFADDGECQGYATIVEGSYERIKTKKGYKCGATLQVNKAALRKDLEQAGVVRSLTSGF